MEVQWCGSPLAIAVTKRQVILGSLSGVVSAHRPRKAEPSWACTQPAVKSAPVSNVRASGNSLILLFIEVKERVGPRWQGTPQGDGFVFPGQVKGSKVVVNQEPGWP